MSTTTLEADVSQPDSCSTSNDNTRTPSRADEVRSAVEERIRYQHIVKAEVKSSLEEKLRNLPSLSFSEIVSIFTVPDGLRKENPLCYTPRLVAIGPLHRDNPQLKPMEDLKLSFLWEFFTLMNNRIDDIIDFIVVKSGFRLFYKETKNIPQEKDLCEMTLLDSVFIIQIFLKKERNDPMFGNYWWFRDLLHDFLLIENQIPLFIPYTIYHYHYCQSGGVHNPTDFTNLASNFFKDVKMASASLPGLAHLSDNSFLTKPSHFIEYLMMANFPTLKPPLQQVSSQSDSTPPLLPLTQKKSNTASRLLEYGVKFVGTTTTTTTSLVQIQFKQREGILTIPQIKVNDWTETLFRNLIAFEHCQYLTPRYVTDYIIFMDSLIDTPEDVNILTKKGIIQDGLQDPERVSELFNNLYKEVITGNRDYYFAKLSCDLNDYRRDCWHQWKAKWYNWMVILRRNYFNSPWSIIKFIAAFILLGLTAVQTLCSIYQAKGIKM